MALANKLSELLKGKGLLALIQTICPLDLHFQLLANVKHKGIQHDLTVLLSISGTASLLQEPKDIETLISNLLGEKGSSTKVTCEKVRYCNREYFAVFIDRPNQT